MLAGIEIPHKEEHTPHFGYRCLHFAETTENDVTTKGYISCNNSSGIFDLSTSNSYEFEMFYLNNNWTATKNSLLILEEDENVELELSVTADENENAVISLSCQTWGINETASTLSIVDFVHYVHVLLRITNGAVKVFINGIQYISADITGDTVIEPTLVKLGGNGNGYLDEFAFRHASGASTPTIPTQPYNGLLNVDEIGGVGTGSDGDVTIDGDAQINSYGMITSVTNAKTFSVASWSNGTYVPAVGTEVMIHIDKMKGSASDYLGLYVFRKIASIDGNNVTLNKNIRGEFELNSELISNYYVQVITVPNFNTLTVESECEIVPLTWEQTTGGGIVAFRCKGNCTINGEIITYNYGVTRTDVYQMTHSKLIDRFLFAMGGGIFITCGGTFTATNNARLGGLWSGEGDGRNGAAGYGGNTGEQTGFGGVGGGAGAGVTNYSGCPPINCGEHGESRCGGGGCEGLRSSTSSYSGGGGGGQGGSGGYGTHINNSYSVSNRTGINGGTVSSGGYGGGGGAPGGNGGTETSGTFGPTTAGKAGACIILICKRLSFSVMALSTGGGASISTIWMNNSTYGMMSHCIGAGGTGFAYIACESVVTS